MKKIALGLMSGTSADGVSLALASFHGRSFKLLGFKNYPSPAALQSQIRKAPRLQTSEISQLNFALGKYFAKCAVNFLNSTRPKPAVIGSHGQTIYHGPRDRTPNTLQIGEPSFISQATGIPVVANFRAADIAAGGEGAPLIPFFDQHFFGGGPVRALQNIGGIANITVVGKSIQPVAFDNGPGNCLMDWAVRKISRGKLAYDRGGKIAARGKINFAAVKEMSAHPYFNKRPPKSTGLELFNEKFILRSLKKAKPEDLVATLTYFTAYVIRQSLSSFPHYPSSSSPHTFAEERQVLREKCSRKGAQCEFRRGSDSRLKPCGNDEVRLLGNDEVIIISGGGAYNLTLMNHLKDLFSPVPVHSIEKYGLPPQAKEPVAFAFFALHALEGKINHLPETTGAKRACVLGAIYQ